jgi:hypothetical protein
LVHPGFRLEDSKRLQLGERGDMGDHIYQQYSGVPPEADQVSAAELDPQYRSRS